MWIYFQMSVIVFYAIYVSLYADVCMFISVNLCPLMKMPLISLTVPDQIKVICDENRTAEIPIWSLMKPICS